jgi:O-methyltransferase
MDGVDAVRYIMQNDIPGDIVECGVYQGHFEVLWAQELIKSNKTDRHIWMFDTFEGLPPPGPEDYSCENAKYGQLTAEEMYEEWKRQKEIYAGWCYCPLEHVKQNIESTGYPTTKLHYVKGDVMETLNISFNIPPQIAILRLDTDWYISSKFELEKMYDSVVPGGVIIFDDYYQWNGQRQATDEFFKERGLEYEFVDIGNDKTSAIIKK